MKTDSLVNKTESKPHIHAHPYNHLIFDKEANYIHWKKDGIFNKWCRQSWIVIRKEWKYSSLLPCTKLNFKEIKDFNIGPDTLDPIKQKIKNMLELICIGNNFLNRIPTVQALRPLTKKRDFIKQNLLYSKDTTIK